MGSSYSFNATYSLNTALGTTPEIEFGSAEWAMVFVPAGSSVTSLSFYVAPEPGGTYLPLYNGAAAVILTVVAGRAYQVPLNVQGCRAMKLVADAAGAVDISFQE